MKIRVNVDQAAALRRGVNAPTSVTDIEFDPSQLSQADREKIAARLVDGIEVRGPGNRNLLTVDSPTIGAVIEKIDALQAELAEIEARAEKEKAEFQAAVETARPAFIAGLKLEKNVYSQWHIVEPEVGWRILEQLRKDPVYRAKEQECERLREETAKAEKEEKERKDKEEFTKLSEIVRRLGSDMDKERLERGYVNGYRLSELVTELLTKQAFVGCPLSPLDVPSEDDIDLSDFTDDGDSYPEEALPEVIVRDQELSASDINNAVMRRIVAAEKTLKAWRSDAQLTPWHRSISRDHKDIPWTDNYGVKVTLQQEGIAVTNIVAI